MAPKLTNASLERWFNQSIGRRYRTQLVGGACEPEYIPAAAPDGLHRILYRNDYIASALHEMAHWSIAGATRCLQQDYGYWYEPDGRNDQQQALFEQVEVKPQAIEWLFSKACGLPFRVSADNLGQSCGPSDAFVASIIAQVKYYTEHDLPAKARDIALGLLKQFQLMDVEGVFNKNHYSLDVLTAKYFASEA